MQECVGRGSGGGARDAPPSRQLLVCVAWRFVRYQKGSSDLLYHEWFHCKDLGTELQGVFDRFFSSDDYKSGVWSGCVGNPDRDAWRARMTQVGFSALPLARRVWHCSPSLMRQVTPCIPFRRARTRTARRRTRTRRCRCSLSPRRVVRSCERGGPPICGVAIATEPG